MDITPFERFNCIGLLSKEWITPEINSKSSTYIFSKRKILLKEKCVKTIYWVQLNTQKRFVNYINFGG